MAQIALRKKTTGARFQPGITRGLRAATGAPKSYNAKTRTFEFVLASEKPCRTYRFTRDWDIVEVDEILPMKNLVDIDDFVGNGIFEDHRSWRPAIGVIRSARIEGDKLVCTGQLSSRENVAEIAKDVADGIRQAFSIGFEILKDGSPVTRTDDVDLITVRKWRAKEASLVTVPADDSAKMRSALRSLKSRKHKDGDRPMTSEELQELLEGFRSASEGLMTALESLTDGDGDENEDDDANDGDDEDEAPKTRSKKPAAKGKSTPAADAAKVRSIREACKRNGVLDDFKVLEDTGASIEEMRSLLIASARTSDIEIDGSKRPASGKRGGVIRLEDTAAVKGRAKK